VEDDGVKPLVRPAGDEPKATATPAPVASVESHSPSAAKGTELSPTGGVQGQLVHSGSRSKPSATSNSNNPVAGEKTQTMEMTAQPPMVPSRLAAIKNLNSVNAAASPDVDLVRVMRWEEYCAVQTVPPVREGFNPRPPSTAVGSTFCPSNLPLIRVSDCIGGRC